MTRQAYPSDLSDAEWQRLQPLIPAPCHLRRPPKWTRRKIVKAILDVLRTGCQWRCLPHDFPPYPTLFDYFRQWRRAGLWEQVNSCWRTEGRQQMGREAQPSAAILDSQSVKTTEKGGPRL
jgi:transposase